MLKRERIQAVIADVLMSAKGRSGAAHHHVVVQIWRSRGGDLERLVAARRSNDRIRARDRGNNVLHDALRKLPGHALDRKLGSTRRRLLEQPLDVVRVISVELLV